MLNLNKKLDQLEFQFLMWLQIDGDVNTVEKYEELTQEEYQELRKKFFKWYVNSTGINAGGLKNE